MYLYPLLLLIVLSVLLIAINQGIFSLIYYRGAELKSQIAWTEMGPTPLSEKRYTPQGMTWVEGKLIFANTWKNKNSRVYEYDPKTMEILRTFDMPPEAGHTSGLAWDGKFLWGVDYLSNRAYCIRYEESFSSGEVELRGSFDTTLKGTSASCFVPINNAVYLAISDFRNSRRTIFVDHQSAIESGTAEEHIVFEYRNENFSQGLEYINGFLYESENKAYKSIINKIEISKLLDTKDARAATVAQYYAPNRGVEDLAWDGKYIWTSDEVIFSFFKGLFID